VASVSIESVTKVFPNGVKALNDVSLDVGDGEMFALLGPSGCGKTTLLRLLAGLETPNGGRISIGGRDVTHMQPGGRNVAMVFQDYALFPHMTVAENISYPLKVRKLDKAVRRERAEAVGGGLGLKDLMDRRPAQLSGGQQQRVALARAMACDAALFLYDEPLSNLDARLRMEARTLLKRLHRDVRKTTIYVTHDQSEALALADRVAVMERGVIRQIGAPSEVFHRPGNLFVAEFIGSTPMNLIPAKVLDGRVLVGEEALPLSLPGLGQGGVAQAVVLAVRPEYVTLVAQRSAGCLAAEVEVVEDLGTTCLVTLRGSEGLLQAVVPEDRGPQMGDRLFVSADWSRASFYDPSTGERLEAGDGAVLVMGSGVGR
jgi:multiple sugar transport system ATP-binding protein